jgi:hypothetical protein
VPDVFCITVVGGVAVCLVFSVELFLSVWQCALYVVQYCCWGYDSVPGIFCSTVVGGVAVCLVCSAVLLLEVW